MPVEAPNLHKVVECLATKVWLLFLPRKMRYKVLKKIYEKSQFLISWLD